MSEEGRCPPQETLCEDDLEVRVLARLRTRKNSTFGHFTDSILVRLKKSVRANDRSTCTRVNVESK